MNARFIDCFAFVIIINYNSLLTLYIMLHKEAVDYSLNTVITAFIVP